MAGRASQPVRVRHRERQRVLAEDLRLEQAYHARMRRIHRLELHGWGVVRGLELHAPFGDMELAPGMAVDPSGRSLFVPRPVSLKPDLDALWARLGAAVPVDVWLGLVVSEDPCEPRVSETAVPVLTPAANGPPDRGSAAADTAAILADSSPWSETPAAVYLGRLAADGAPDSAARAWYATLRAALVQSPRRRDGAARMHVHSERLDAPGIFSVQLREERTDEKTQETQVTWRDRLSVERDRQVHFRSDPVSNRWTVSLQTRDADPGGGPHQASSAAALRFEPIQAPAEPPRPWRIERLRDKIPEPPAPGAPPPPIPRDSIRFLIRDPGDDGDPKLSRFVFAKGPTSRDRVFSADAQGNVHIKGSLWIQRELYRPNLSLDLRDEAELKKFLVEWARLAPKAGGLEAALPLSVTISAGVATGGERALTIVARNTHSEPVGPLVLGGRPTRKDEQPLEAVSLSIPQLRTGEEVEMRTQLPDGWSFGAVALALASRGRFAMGNALYPEED